MGIKVLDKKGKDADIENLIDLWSTIKLFEIKNW